MRTVFLLSTVLLLSSSSRPLPIRPEGTRPASPPSIRDLAWLEGTWQGKIGERDFEARYSGTDGGQVLSASKYTKEGVAAGFEFERFEELDGTLVLTPFPEGKSSVTFKLAELDPKSRRAVFENLAHDFPTRLSYQRVADNKLTILVSGPGEDGLEQVLTYSLALKR
ncbi:MAG: hypothetical protein QOK27_53 [Gemmatimonadales bacterium]|jgi:hypothetical protein|nr:hypothetical protein [Gemmatimonadales bacterium]